MLAPSAGFEVQGQGDPQSGRLLPVCDEGELLECQTISVECKF